MNTSLYLIGGALNRKPKSSQAVPGLSRPTQHHTLLHIPIVEMKKIFMKICEFQISRESFTLLHIPIVEMKNIFMKICEFQISRESFFNYHCYGGCYLVTV